MRPLEVALIVIVVSPAILGVMESMWPDMTASMSDVSNVSAKA